MSEKLNYEISIETANALADLMKLSKGNETLASTSKKITSDSIKQYEKEVSKSAKSIDTMSFSLDRLNKASEENKKKILDAEQALKSDAYVNSAKKISGYEDNLKTLGASLKKAQQDHKQWNIETQALDFNKSQMSIIALKDEIIKTKEAIKSESKEAKDASKIRDDLSKRQIKLDRETKELNKKIDDEKTKLKNLNNELKNVSNSSKTVEQEQSKLGGSLSKLKGLALGAGAALGGMFALNKLLEYRKEALNTFKELEQSAAKFAGVVKNMDGVSMKDAGGAVKEIIDYGQGQITGSQAQDALSNYIQYGMSLKQAKEMVIRELDLATNNRESHYSLGEAVVTTAKGYRTGNSNNIDASGNEVNGSKQYSDYAKKINKNAADLSQQDKVNATIRTSEEGWTKTRGDLAKATNTLAGSEAKVRAEWQKTSAFWGSYLASGENALNSLYGGSAKAASGILSEFRKGQISAGYLMQVATVNPFSNDSSKEYQQLAKLRQEQLKQLEKEKNGWTPGSDSNTKGKKKELEKNAEELEAAKRLEQESILRIEKLNLEESLINLKLNADDKIEETQKYKDEVIKILDQISAKDIAIKTIEFEVVQKRVDAPVLNKEDSEARAKDKERLSEIKKEKAEILVKTKDEKDKVQKVGTKSSGGGREITARDLSYSRYNYERQLLENQLALTKEISKQELSVIDDKFQEFEISAEEYYQRKKELVDKDFEYQASIAQKELAFEKSYKGEDSIDEQQRLANVARLETQLQVIQLQRKEAVASLTREHEKYNKQLELNKKYLAIESNTKKEIHSANIDKTNNELKLSMLQISNSDMLIIEEAHQKRLYDIEKKGMLERLKLTKNPEELDRINDEIEDLEREHTERVLEIHNKMVLEQNKNYLSMTNTAKDTIDKIIDDASSGFSNLKDILNSFFKDLWKMQVKKTLNTDSWTADGGFISNFLKRATGEGNMNVPSSTAPGTAPGAGQASGLGSLFGMGGAGASSVGAQTINAATVFVNGKVSGGEVGNAMKDALSANTDMTATADTVISEAMTSVEDGFSGLFSGLESGFTSFFSGLSSIFSSMGSGGSGAGLGSLFSAFTGALPGFAVGSPKLPYDMPALVHKGEGIIPRGQNERLSAYLDAQEKGMSSSSASRTVNNVNNISINGTLDKKTATQSAHKMNEIQVRAMRR